MAQVANIPGVKQEIEEFIKEENLHNELLEIIDFINPSFGNDSDDEERQRQINADLEFKNFQQSLVQDF